MNTAIDDGAARITFAQLQAAVDRLVPDLASAPATLAVDENARISQQLTQFLAIVQSGRCAAVGDPSWPAAVRAAVRQQLERVPPPSSGDAPFYIGFTSGSTGLPKGFRRTHRSWIDSFDICVKTFGDDARGTVLAPGRPSNSLFLFGMLFGLWTGGGVVVQDTFSAPRALQTLHDGAATCLFAVPSQLLVMLEGTARQKAPPTSATRLILIGGARWPRHRTPELRALFPNARIVEFYGASETSFVAWHDVHEDTPYDVVGRPFSNVEVDVRNGGLIYVRSPMVFMDYVNENDDATAALRDGNWICVRDIGSIDDQGRLHVAGRQQRMITVGGKKVFADEVEGVLMAHPQVLNASVHGMDDALRGQQVAAVVQAAPGTALTAALLAEHCRGRLEPHKVCRKVVFVNEWPLTAGGKTDHAALGCMLGLGSGTLGPHPSPLPPAGEAVNGPLSRWRERAGVRAER